MKKRASVQATTCFACALPSGMARQTKPAWSKVLYKKQPFADNYVDSKKFLDEMRKNVNTRTYTFGQIATAACVVSHQMSSVVLFIAVFCYMYFDWLHPTLVLSVTLPISFGSYLLLGFWTGQEWSEHSDALKSTFLILAFSYGLSPVLKTLTQSVSTDTIYSMTLVMLLAHLVVHDYDAGSGIPIVSPPLSMNAAVFAAVCLASRLPSPWHTFATLTFAMALLVFLPLLRKRIMEGIPSCQVWLALPFALVTVIILSTLTSVGTAGFVLVQLAVVVLCPYIYCSMQQYKNNIHGPWDEALPDTHAGPRTPEERLYHENWTENGNRAGSDNDA